MFIKWEQYQLVWAHNDELLINQVSKTQEHFSLLIIIYFSAHKNKLQWFMRTICFAHKLPPSTIAGDTGGSVDASPCKRRCCGHLAKVSQQELPGKVTSFEDLWMIPLVDHLCHWPPVHQHVYRTWTQHSEHLPLIGVLGGFSCFL